MSISKIVAVVLLGGALASPLPGASMDLAGLYASRLSDVFQVNVTASPQTGGSVSGGGKFDKGSWATISAKAQPGYQFVNWTVAGVDFNRLSTFAFVVSSNQTLVAHFIQTNIVGMQQGLRREIFTDLPGSNLVDLVRSSKFPHSPDIIDSVSLFESEYLPNNAADFYGQRLTGWLIPPVTGSYIFYLAADNAAQVFLSSDDSPYNKQVILQEPTSTPSRQWQGIDQHPLRASENIFLTAGKRYYVEVLHKEGDGEDHIGLAWQLPGGSAPINGAPPISSEHMVYQFNMPEAIWSVNPMGGGTVTMNPAPLPGGFYADGTVVTLTAVPAYGYQFSGWSGVISGLANPATLVIDGRQIVRANFTPQYADVVKAGDPVIPTLGYSPSGEGAGGAIDNNLYVKYFNAEKLNTGFTVTPSAGSTLVTGIGLTSAEDLPDRDPASFRLEGSHDGNTFTVIATGSIPFFIGRIEQQNVFFTNVIPYEIYRLIFPTIANLSADGMQISEVQFFGTVGSAPPSYLISAMTSPVNSGAVEFSPSSPGGKYLINSTVTLTARAASGYEFVNWTEGLTVVGSSPAFTLTVTGARSLVANFKEVIPQYQVQVSASPPEAGVVTGSGTYSAGSQIAVNAFPHSGYRFEGWTDRGFFVSRSATYLHTLIADVSLVAQFSPIIPQCQVQVSASPTNGGTVTGGGIYTLGDSIKVTAVASTGYRFVNWMENGKEVSRSAIFDSYVLGDRVLLANFTFVTPVYQVQVSGSPASAGNVSGGGEYSLGTVVRVTAVPNAGYQFISWMEGDREVSRSAVYEFSLLENRTLWAQFAAVSTQYQVAVSATPVDGGFVTGGGKYNSGAAVKIIATPFSGYRFVNWTEGAVEISRSESYEFSASGNRSLVAHFTVMMPQYQVTVSAFPAAGGMVSGEGMYDSRTGVTVLATPNSGYEFKYWTEGDILVSSVPDYIFPITDNRNLVAHFAPINVVEYFRGLRRQIYTNLPGATVADLTGSYKFPHKPDLTDSVPNLDSQYLPSNAANNYGQRLTGWLVPPYSGSYVFYLTADDTAQLFLSTDDTPSQKKLIIDGTTRIPYLYWEGTAQTPAQASPIISMTGGQHYYIEVRHKESAGGDYVAVTWQKPGSSSVKNGASPISSDYLIYLDEMPESEPPQIIKAVCSQGVLTLSWDYSAVGYVLESSPSLKPGAPWIAVTGVVNNQINIPTKNSARFYRLRKE